MCEDTDETPCCMQNDPLMGFEAKVASIQRISQGYFQVKAFCYVNHGTLNERLVGSVFFSLPAAHLVPQIDQLLNVDVSPLQTPPLED